MAGSLLWEKTRQEQGLCALLNKSWKQSSTKQQLYGHLLSITQIIQVRQIRYAGHCSRSKDKLISDILLWTSTCRHASVGWAAKTYIHQLCADIRCCLEDWPIVMEDERERERDKGIHAVGILWWWYKAKHFEILVTMNAGKHKWLLWERKLIFYLFLCIHLLSRNRMLVLHDACKCWWAREFLFYYWLLNLADLFCCKKEMLFI